MAITFSCNSCGNQLRVADENAGKRAKCPKCQTILRIPTANAASQPGTPQVPSSSGPEPFDFPDLGNDDSTGNPFDAVSDFGASATANPFQAPSYTAPASPATASRKGGHQIVDFGEVYAQGMARYQKQIGMGALYTLIYLGISVATGIVGQVISVGFNIAGVLELIIVGAIVVQLFQSCVGAFQASIAVRFGLNVATNREPLDRIFAGKLFLPILAANLLFLLAFGLIGAIAAIPATIGFVTQHPEPEIFIIISVVIGPVLVIAFSIFCIRYMLFAFFIVDEGTGVFKSLELSAKYTKGNKLTLFLLFLTFGIVGMIAILATCGIGMFFVVPFCTTTAAVFYLKATGKYQNIR